MNIGSFHGENSIHILNRIIIQTPANDEVSFNVNQCVTDLCQRIVAERSVNSIFDPTILPVIPSDLTTTTATSTATSTLNLPLLSGFCTVYLPHIDRPLAKITFMPPINEDPNALSTSQSCLQAIKASFIDSNYQEEAVVVAKRLDPIDNKSIFVYPDDFHTMKNFMIVIWDVLNGSGIEDAFGLIYKAAAHRAMLNVHNFNYSLRPCKLLYTALAMLFIESFVKTSVTSARIIDDLKKTLANIPSDYAVTNIKQQWFTTMIIQIKKLDLTNVMNNWAIEQGKTNLSFKFWYFIYQKLLQPLILLYMSIRLSNFNGRNAALTSTAPIFFSTSHRNYARLCAQHLMDLRSSSNYLFRRLEQSFAVYLYLFFKYK
ncbi:unnamed protein product [Didymodactylos carnosus]|uniref:Uncharacterized protein n=1 Tax=Didymodactylos carnosus TaxID=1234261 RepID=A0A814PAP3_9BILA|nr:unnamed protein product [Didymodactylos carnosus]CAF1105301.1 unnamed protein product [Didymodactylos carnosus]CAF3740646.1 unnamed protein product [Didymodactylos carnosus]CAF3869863.1 unnamed protein product [Didymodactylos carnosus]